jgi:hypothetical protein
MYGTSFSHRCCTQYLYSKRPARIAQAARWVISLPDANDPRYQERPEHGEVRDAARVRVRAHHLWQTSSGAASDVDVPSPDETAA